MSNTHANRALAIAAASAVLLSSASCGTIVNGRTRKIEFTSQPSGARVEIPGHGTIITPATIRLERERSHTVVFRLEGYEEQTVSINRSLSPWILGNIIFGGIPGIIVDAITGGWATLSPGQVSVDFKPVQTPEFGPPQAPLLPSPNSSPP